MSAPSEADINQLVKIQRGQRLATSPELNPTFREVTNWVKLGEWMYQAATKVNVLSPVMSNVVEVDAFHSDRRQHHCDERWRGNNGSTGVLGSGTIQDGKYLNLGDPLDSLKEEYAKTSRKGQELANGPKEVGLTDSTRRTGKPATWGSGQHKRDSLSDKRWYIETKVQTKEDKLKLIAKRECVYEEPYAGKSQVRFCEGSHNFNNLLTIGVRL